MSTEARSEKTSAALASSATHYGRFLVLEGIDGAGKSTIARTLAERLRSEGRDTVLTAEPTSTWLGDAVHRANGEDLSPFAETLLYVADRAEHTRCIKGWLEEGKWVVCDRYVGSTLAYQSITLASLMGATAYKWLRTINEPLTIQPGHTFLLKIDPAIAMERLSDRTSKEKFEKLEFLRQVDAAYDRIARDDGYAVIDASLPPEKVLDAVLAFIDA